MKKRTKKILLFLIITISLVIGLYTFALTYAFCDCSSQTDLTQLTVQETYNLPLTQFKIHIGHYPTTEEGLAALLAYPSTPNWKGPYLKSADNLLDAWGTPFQYRSPGIHNPDSYDLSSFGQDGIPSSDDITNW